jgi:hypothetical protein
VSQPLVNVTPTFLNGNTTNQLALMSADLTALAAKLKSAARRDGSIIPWKILNRRATTTFEIQLSLLHYFAII